MTVSALAGTRPEPHTLVNIPRLVTAYYSEKPDPDVPSERVAFGTSGHRGSSFHRSFNEDHILAITEAIVEYRKTEKTDGPLFLGMDTHALSEPALVTALEVLAAQGVEVLIAEGDEYTPTPALSRAILAYNRGRKDGLADGIVITPSHNPPEDGGFKYNPPHGGPAGTEATKWIEDRANTLIAGGLDGIRRVDYAKARTVSTTHRYDFLGTYVDDLVNVVDMDVIRNSGLRLGVDPLGGAGVGYWSAIAERHRLPLEVVSDRVDPTFAFMTLDWDGKIRMDPSSRYTVESLIANRDRFDVAFACDTDHDRHGIVTRGAGLLQPNHYLSVAVSYLYAHRPGWKPDAAVGKTVVSSSMIDRVTAGLGRRLHETPVGFKWFVDGLFGGTLGFGGEESAGASFLRTDGTVWTTDKDGIILGLLSAEITARTGKDPAELYRGLTGKFGDPVYDRIEGAATPEGKKRLSRLSPDEVKAQSLAGDPITAILTHAPGNGAAIGGLKVSTKNGWFAARPSGTEDIYKIYAESFLGEDHLRRIQAEAQAIVDETIG